MRRIMEKTAAGSALRWLHSSIWEHLALLLLNPGLTMVSGVGAMSVGSLVTPRPGEAIVMCPLIEDVWQTKHHVVISHFPYKGHTVKVFHCSWLKKDPGKPDCISHHDFTLEALENDYVVASVPRTQLHTDGSYKCQLVPPDDDEPFTRCLVFQSDDAEDPPTTISAVTPSISASLPQPRDHTEEEHTCANGYYPEVLAVILTVVLILLVIVIVMAVMIFLLWRARKGPTPEVTSGNVMPLSGVASRGEEGHDVTPGGAAMSVRGVASTDEGHDVTSEGAAMLVRGVASTDGEGHGVTSEGVDTLVYTNCSFDDNESEDSCSHLAGEGQDTCQRP